MKNKKTLGILGPSPPNEEVIVATTVEADGTASQSWDSARGARSFNRLIGFTWFYNPNMGMSFINSSVVEKNPP